MATMRINTPGGFVVVPAGASYRGVNLASVPKMKAALKRLYRYHADYCPELLDFFDETPSEFLKDVLNTL